MALVCKVEIRNFETAFFLRCGDVVSYRQQCLSMGWGDCLFNLLDGSAGWLRQEINTNFPSGCPEDYAN